MQSYQWTARDYAASSSAQQGWARELIRKLELKGSETLLDIGCGDGNPWEGPGAKSQPRLLRVCLQDMWLALTVRQR
jgi:hypothetical protein